MSPHLRATLPQAIVFDCFYARGRKSSPSMEAGATVVDASGGIVSTCLIPVLLGAVAMAPLLLSSYWCRISGMMSVLPLPLLPCHVVQQYPLSY